MTFFDIIYICFATMGLPLQIDIYACQHNHVEGSALSQERKPQTRTAANCVTCQHISDFFQQNFQGESVIRVHVGLSRMPSTGSTW